MHSVAAVRFSPSKMEGGVSTMSISLFLCFSRLVAGSVIEAANLIETTCSKTGYHDLCISTLSSAPRSSSADVKGLVETALEEARRKSNETLDYFIKLLPWEGKPALWGKCQNIIPEAVTDLANNQFASAKESATTAATNAQWCEDQFMGSSPAMSQNKSVLQFWLQAILGTLGK